MLYLQTCNSIFRRWKNHCQLFTVHGGCHCHAD